MSFHSFHFACNLSHFAEAFDSKSDLLISKSESNSEWKINYELIALYTGVDQFMSCIRIDD